MNIQHLRYFAVMMETRSVSRAAVRLGISQPTLSSALKKIEQEYGTKFFVPAGRGLKALPAAEILFTHVRSALRSLAEARREIDGKSSLRLRVGVIPSLAQAWLTELMDCFEIDVDLQVAMPDALASRLASGGLDVALTTLPEDWSGEARILYREPFRLFLALGHPLAGGSAIKADILRDFPFVLRQSCEMLGTATRMMEVLHIRLAIVARTDQEALAARLVSLGQGVTLAPAGWGYPGVTPIAVEGLSLSRLVGIAWQGEIGQHASEQLLRRVRPGLAMAG